MSSRRPTRWIRSFGCGASSGFDQKRTLKRRKGRRVPDYGASPSSVAFGSSSHVGGPYGADSLSHSAGPYGASSPSHAGGPGGTPFISWDGWPLASAPRSAGIPAPAAVPRTRTEAITFDTLSRNARSVGLNASSRSESMSISATADPSFITGTTISDRVLRKHGRYLGSLLTSGTTIVDFSSTAAPQIPSPDGIRVCCVALGPDHASRTSSAPSTA